MEMKRIRNREDKAVSPIIATVLLVGITVTMIATAYTLLSDYIPSPVPQTPTAAIKVVYDTSQLAGNYSGNYSVYISSLDGNVSVNDVVMIVTFSNHTVDEISLGAVYNSNGTSNETASLAVYLYSSNGYITSTSTVRLQLKDSPSSISRIALVDTVTNGAIGSTLLQ